MFFNHHCYFIGSSLCAIALSSCIPKPWIQITDQTDLPDFYEKVDTPHRSQNSKLKLAHIAGRVKYNHPQLLAARKAVEVAKGKLLQSGRLENPEIEISAAKGIPSSTGEIEVSFSQRFPITNKLELDKRVHQDAVELARAEIKIAELQLINEAQLLAVDILGVDQQIVLIGKQQEAYTNVMNWILEASSRGEMSKLDANSPQLEIESLNLQKQQLINKQSVLKNRLKGMVGLKKSGPLNLSGKLPLTNIPTQQLVMSQHPLYQVEQLAIKQAKSRYLYQKAERYDDVEMKVFSSVGREEDAPDGLNNEGTLGLGVTIPLPLYDKNEGNIQAAHEQVEQEILESNALVAEIKNKTENTILEMRNWNTQNTLLKEKILPLAEKNNRQLEEVYQSGQGDYLSYLQAKKQIIELEQKRISYDIEFHRARVQYFSAIGKQHLTF